MYIYICTRAHPHMFPVRSTSSKKLSTKSCYIHAHLYMCTYRHLQTYTYTHIHTSTHIHIHMHLSTEINIQRKALDIEQICCMSYVMCRISYVVCCMSCMTHDMIYDTRHTTLDIEHICSMSTAFVCRMS